MSKVKTVFICQQCGAQSPKWAGQCPSCGRWGTLTETLVEKKSSFQRSKRSKINKAIRLSEVESKKIVRFSTNIAEFDRVLGGGIVPGSIVLVAGEPGMGKSTLLTQVALSLSEHSASSQLLYVCGEESPTQVKMRVNRLSPKPNNTAWSRLFLLPETRLESVVDTIHSLVKDYKSGIVPTARSSKTQPPSGLKPSRLETETGNQSTSRPVSNPKFPQPLIIIDSIQTLSSDELTSTAGSIGQVRFCSQVLQKTAKDLNIPIFLVGHVTKSGAIAGPKVLEHLVDTVIYLEGERTGRFRLLRTQKNRFGSTDEVGVFEMTDKGLSQVANPSGVFLQERQKSTPGSVVVPILEGSRAVLVEIQALVSPTQLPVPRRVANGINPYRLQMLLAVIAKQLHLPLGSNDVYVNVAGGIRVNQPAADLGVCLAIISSFKNKILPPNAVVIGEVGLLGELRQVSRLQKRVEEAKNLGFAQALTPNKFKTLRQAVASLFPSGR